MQAELAWNIRLNCYWSSVPIIEICAFKQAEASRASGMALRLALRRLSSKPVPLGLASDQVVSIRESAKTFFNEAVAVLGFGVAAAQDDACHSSHKAKADCDADTKCTWCEASAVPSACYTKENAAKLPPAVFTCATRGRRYRSELLPRAEVEKLGVEWRGNATHQSSHELLDAAEYPSDFSWCNKDGKPRPEKCKELLHYVSKSAYSAGPTVHQSSPCLHFVSLGEYCGSCWAHGAISALGDRIKIARNAQGIDINVAVQHLLNCGGVGTCKGGSVDGPYQWLMEISKKGTGISYETANPYVACSSDSDEGFCKHVDTSCKALNVARTCGSFSQEGGPCTGLGEFPNATISDYGSISGADAMMKEIFHRGPISCGVDANPLLNYESGIIKTKGEGVDHVVSVVGWGTDPKDGMTSAPGQSLLALQPQRRTIRCTATRVATTARRRAQNRLWSEYVPTS
eukprot:s2459_g8.t1